MLLFLRSREYPRCWLMSTALLPTSSQGRVLLLWRLLLCSSSCSYCSCFSDYYSYCSWYYSYSYFCRVNRLSVLGAITSVQHRLKLYTKVNLGEVIIGYFVISGSIVLYAPPPGASKRPGHLLWNHRHGWGQGKEGSAPRALKPYVQFLFWIISWSSCF